MITRTCKCSVVDMGGHVVDIKMIMSTTLFPIVISTLVHVVDMVDMVSDLRAGNLSQEKSGEGRGRARHVHHAVK